MAYLAEYLRLKDRGDPCDNWTEGEGLARARAVYRLRCATRADLERCVEDLWMVYSWPLGIHEVLGREVG